MANLLPGESGGQPTDLIQQQLRDLLFGHKADGDVPAMPGVLPTQKTMQDAETTRTGALGALREAANTPATQTPAWLHGVNAYLKNMRPGWNAVGLGQGVAALTEGPQAEQLALRKQQDAERLLEYNDAVKRQTEQETLLKAAIPAAMRAAAPFGGAVGKWVQSKDDQGNLYWTNNVTGEQKVVPATKMPQWEKARSEAYRTAVKQEMENPEQYAVDYANRMIGESPKGIAPTAAARPQTTPIPGSPGKEVVPSPSPEAAIVPGEAKSEGALRELANIDEAAATPDQTMSPKTLAKEYVDAEKFATTAKTPAAIDSATAALTDLKGKIDQLPPDVKLDLQRNIDRYRNNPNEGTKAAVEKAATRSLSYLDQVKRKGEEGYAGEAGKDLAKEYKALNEASSASARMQSQLGLLEQLYSNPNLPEGELAEKIQSVRSGMKSLGIPVGKEVGAADLAGAIAKNFALHLRTGEGTNLLPGAMSNYEDQMLQKMAPALSLTSEGRLALIQYMREINASNMRIAKEAQIMAGKNKNGQLPVDWPQRKSRVEKEEMARLTQKFRELSSKFGV